ncbi:hypothetical protein K438DRAFT_1777777 [Mycena galopus ATCC 62051]|nr:hypothetical protein K438DRAFT_1777777 [Mycena galopus ATCC 62051]
MVVDYREEEWKERLYSCERGDPSKFESGINILNKTFDKSITRTNGDEEGTGRVDSESIKNRLAESSQNRLRIEYSDFPYWTESKDSQARPVAANVLPDAAAVTDPILEQRIRAVFDDHRYCGGPEVRTLLSSHSPKENKNSRERYVQVVEGIHQLLCALLGLCIQSEEIRSPESLKNIADYASASLPGKILWMSVKALPSDSLPNRDSEYPPRATGILLLSHETPPIPNVSRNYRAQPRRICTV